MNEVTCKGEIQMNSGTLKNNLECYKIKWTTMGKENHCWIYEGNYIVLWKNIEKSKKTNIDVKEGNLNSLCQ